VRKPAACRLQRLTRSQKPASDCEIKVADAAQPRGMQDLPRAKASEIDVCDALDGQVLLCLDAIIKRPLLKKDGHQRLKRHRPRNARTSLNKPGTSVSFLDEAVNSMTVVTIHLTNPLMVALLIPTPDRV
jgi:hypothetical protein